MNALYLLAEKRNNTGIAGGAVVGLVESANPRPQGICFCDDDCDHSGNCDCTACDNC